MMIALVKTQKCWDGRGLESNRRRKTKKERITRQWRNAFDCSAVVAETGASFNGWKGWEIKAVQGDEEITVDICWAVNGEEVNFRSNQMRSSLPKAHKTELFLSFNSFDKICWIWFFWISPRLKTWSSDSMQGCDFWCCTPASSGFLISTCVCVFVLETQRTHSVVYYWRHKVLWSLRPACVKL